MTEDAESLTLAENCRACGGPVILRNRFRTFVGSKHLEVECQGCNRHGLISRNSDGRVTKRRGQVFDLTAPHGGHHEY